MKENRCNACGLWKIKIIDKCPECGDNMDLEIKDLSLSWKCRKCEYGVATTANKLCFWDNGNFSEDCYPKLDGECPYGKTIK